MAWLKKWWKILALGVVMALGAVASVFRKRPEDNPNEAFDNLHDQQKEQNNVQIEDVSERLEEAQDALEEAEKAGQHKVLEIDKEEYSDAEKAVDNFNRD